MTQREPEPAGAYPAVDERFLEQAARLSNWGRWGQDDQRGTVNYITDRTVLEASRLVRRGQLIALGVALDGDGPQRGRERRMNPRHYVTELPRDHIRADGSGTGDDEVWLPTQAATQWDGLSHKSFRGLIYNGRSHDLVTSAGAAVNDIRSISDRIVARGVLVDVPRWKGVDALEPSDEIGTDDLVAVLRAQQCEVGEGDILLVRTGHLECCRQQQWRGYYGAAPGLGVDTLDWIHERRLAGVASDTGAVEVRPSTVPGVSAPFHVIALVYMGLLVGEIFDLEALASACAADGAYDFLLTAAPLPITGGLASPINPYAVR